MQELGRWQLVYLSSVQQQQSNREQTNAGQPHGAKTCPSQPLGGAKPISYILQTYYLPFLHSSATEGGGINPGS
jgi:hypothetical protein